MRISTFNSIIWYKFMIDKSSLSIECVYTSLKSLFNLPCWPHPTDSHSFQKIQWLTRYRWFLAKQQNPHFTSIMTRQSKNQIMMCVWHVWVCEPCFSMIVCDDVLYGTWIWFHKKGCWMSAACIAFRERMYKLIGLKRKSTLFQDILTYSFQSRQFGCRLFQLIVKNKIIPGIYFVIEIQNMCGGAHEIHWCTTSSKRWNFNRNG